MSIHKNPSKGDERKHQVSSQDVMYAFFREYAEKYKKTRMMRVLGVARTTYYKLLNGEIKVSPDHIDLIAAEEGMELHQLHKEISGLAYMMHRMQNVVDKGDVKKKRYVPVDTLRSPLTEKAQQKDSASR